MYSMSGVNAIFVDVMMYLYILLYKCVDVKTDIATRSDSNSLPILYFVNTNMYIAYKDEHVCPCDIFVLLFNGTTTVYTTCDGDKINFTVPLLFLTFEK